MQLVDLGRAAGELAGGALDLTHPRQEDEDVARLAVEGDPGRLGRAGAGQMVQGDGVLAAGGADDGGTVEEARYRLGVERGGHDEEAKVGAERAFHLAGEGEAEIGVERALVELVEDHEADAVEPGIGLQAADEEAFSYHFEAGGGAGPALEAHGVTDCFSDLLAEEIGHALRRLAGGEAARLEHQDRSTGEPGLGQQQEGDERGLARAGRCGQHGPAGIRQGAAQPRDGFGDRERAECLAQLQRFSQKV